MILSGLHLLLTYKCTYECDHCFAWGSPKSSGVMTLPQLENIMDQAESTEGVKEIFFEGGEPFLYYMIMLKGIDLALGKGFSTGIVSNAYWANTHEDALAWLAPLAGKVGTLTISSDLFHADEEMSRQAVNAAQAAKELGINLSNIQVAQPEETSRAAQGEEMREGWANLRYRGRAAVELAPKAEPQPVAGFDSCPCEDLADPGRVHVDPLGNLHVCQGIIIGNMFETPLAEICKNYDPDNHPVVGPLLKGGPLALAKKLGADLERPYADACHLCYAARDQAGKTLPGSLGPDQMYGRF